MDIRWEKILVENTTHANVTALEDESQDGRQKVLRKVWSGRVQSSDHGRRLTVEGTTSKDSGLYTCTAENEAGTASKDIVVTVLG